MTTTSHTSSAPAAHAAAPAQAAAQQRAPGGPAASADLFASLLALVADAPALATDTPALTPTGPAQEATDAADANTDAPTDPLAALLAWVTPGLPTAPTSPTGTAASGSDAPTDTTAAITSGPELPALTAETRRIDGATERMGAIELPASASPAARTAAPAWLAGALRTGHAQGTGSPDKAATPGSDVALRWQRGASAEHASPVALAMRSTVALGERSAGAGPAPWAAAWRESAADTGLPGASPVHGARQGSDGLAVGAPGAGTGTEPGGGDSASADGTRHDSSADHNEPTTDALGRDAAAEEAVDVSHWGSGSLRQASLRVGEAGEQAIDIQLSVRGDEVQVAFRTDDEQARDLLRQQANESLADRLLDNGMLLGGVSVGAQGQPSSGHEPAPRSTRALAATRAATPEPAATGMAPARTRADGGPALDLFI